MKALSATGLRAPKGHTVLMQRGFGGREGTLSHSELREQSVTRRPRAVGIHSSPTDCHTGRWLRSMVIFIGS